MGGRGNPARAGSPSPGGLRLKVVYGAIAPVEFVKCSENTSFQSSDD